MATMAKYKTALRTAIRRKAVDHEAMFLNITAMMDMMTIILVFLLKGLAASSASMPSSADLALPSSILASSETPPEAGIEVVISREKVLVNGVQIKGLEVPNCFNSAAEGPKPTEPYRLFFCPGDSSSGFATKYKSRGTKQDLEISPLLNAVRDPVLIAEENSKRQNKGVATVEARIFFDRYTSFRVMTEVLFTLGLAKVSKFHFIAMKESK